MDCDAVSGLFERFDRELWLVTAQAGARRGGLIATFVSRASLVPALPRALIALANHHYTRELIEDGRAFAMHLVAEDQLEWVWRFGLRSGRGFDKLDGLATHRGATGSPILADAPAWLDCRVEARLEIGDRTVYVGEVVAAHVGPFRSALTRNRLVELAPADQCGEMDRAVAHDIAVDRAAILDWRRR